MMAARLVRLPLTTFVTSLSKPALGTALRSPCIVCRTQNYASQARTSLRRVKGRTLKESAMSPAGDAAFTAGKALVAGASVMGLGALCYYGLGMSKDLGAIDRMAIWPDIVRERIRGTYMYFGASIGLTALSAVAVFRTPALISMMTRGGWLALGATFAAMIGSGMVVRSIPYKEGFGSKQLAWMVHCGIMGAVVAPLIFLGGPILTRAAWYTAGVVGGLSTVAMCAPSEKFLNMGGPLAIGLGIVFASSLGSMFLPASTALGASLYSVSIYGGLVLFGMFLLYDTQRIIKKAETHPVNAVMPYDPLNASISIYLDTLNIFIRIAMILAGGGNRRK